MSEFDKSKVMIIGENINYAGDINDDVLHIVNLKKIGMELFGNDSVFKQLNEHSSLNLGVLEFIKNGKIVFLNLSRFGEKYALIYFPPSINEKMRLLVQDVLSQMIGYDVLADFCDFDVSENLFGDTFNDSYDEGFYEVFSHLEQIVQKNKGF